MAKQRKICHSYKEKLSIGSTYIQKCTHKMSSERSKNNLSVHSLNAYNVCTGLNSDQRIILNNINTL